ncbi:MAG: 3-hydroxyacyl-CoA dehydrogenase family protein [Candidatus Cyclobacteriaceae bacterium M2_1C_046]
MKILVIGAEGEFNLVKNKLGDAHDYEHVEDVSLALQNFEEQDLVIDFLIEDYPDNIEAYKDIEGLSVLLNTPKITLTELRFYNPDISCKMIGFNGLPGFFQYEKWELTIFNSEDKEHPEKLFNKLNQQYYIVKDRVGMVSPRVICMIINEAYFTVQEGTASREGIDLGMKLGTNYPYGPFEWVERIGINHVYELLEALYDDTKDERYKICPLLKSEYLSYTG